MPRPLAILLCAGYGTRMGALTAETPKPLLPLAGRPVLDYLLEQLSELDGLGAVHVVSNAKYLAAFRTWAEGWRRRFEVAVHDDGSTADAGRLGAVGDLAFALARVEAPAGALVAAGDNVFRFSLRPLWRAFLETGRSTVLALEEDDPEKLQRTGVLELGAGDRVLRLHEKPERPPSRWACPSLYGLSARALACVGPYLAAGGSRDEIGRFVADLALRQPVYAVRTAGERLHVGSPEAWRRADEALRRV